MPFISCDIVSLSWGDTSDWYDDSPKEICSNKGEYILVLENKVTGCLETFDGIILEHSKHANSLEEAKQCLKDELNTPEFWDVYEISELVQLAFIIVNYSHCEVGYNDHPPCHTSRGYASSSFRYRQCLENSGWGPEEWNWDEDDIRIIDVTNLVISYDINGYAVFDYGAWNNSCPEYCFP